jgi:hypothetical protein
VFDVDATRFEEAMAHGATNIDRKVLKAAIPSRKSFTLGIKYPFILYTAEQ